MQALAQERDQLAKHLQDARNAVAVLEEQVERFSEQQVDPEELEEVLIELESHKKALKALTSQYNVLEQHKNELERQLAQRSQPV